MLDRFEKITPSDTTLPEIEDKLRDLVLMTPTRSLASADCQGKIFSTPSTRRNVYLGSQALAEYCNDKQISNVIFLDKAARPAHVGLSSYWAKAFPGLQKPGLHFINPVEPRKLFVTDSMRKSPHSRLSTYLMKQQQSIGLKLSPDQTDKPVLLFDSCLHTGETLRTIQLLLQAAGFDDVRLGAFSDDRSPYALARADMTVLDKTPDEFPCYPFGPSFSITTRTTGICSIPDRDQANRQLDRQGRQEIRTIVDTGFAIESAGGIYMGEAA